MIPNNNSNKSIRSQFFLSIKKLSMSILYCILLAFYAYSLDCTTLPSQTITLTFYSDLDDWIVGNLYPNGAYAVAAGNSYTRSVQPYGLAIWESAYPYDIMQNLTCYIGKSFYVPGTPISAKLSILADDKSSVKLNNLDTGCNTIQYNILANCDLTPYIASGLNTLNITVNNSAGKFATQNLAWLNYCLTIITSVKAIDIV